MIEYLKVHKEGQDRHRSLFGTDYRSDLDLIFADPSGNYLLPSSAPRAAVRLAKKAGLLGIGLHCLRHTHASALLHGNVPITNVSKRLEHRDVYTTAKIYAHAIPGTDQDVAAKWDALMAERPTSNLGVQIGTKEEEGKAIKQ